MDYADFTNTSSERRWLCLVAIHCGENRSTQRKPLTLDRQPLSCYMPVQGPELRLLLLEMSSLIFPEKYFLKNQMSSAALLIQHWGLPVNCFVNVVGFWGKKYRVFVHCLKLSDLSIFQMLIMFVHCFSIWFHWWEDWLMTTLAT